MLIQMDLLLNIYKHLDKHWFQKDIFSIFNIVTTGRQSVKFEEIQKSHIFAVIIIDMLTDLEHTFTLI